MLVSWAKSGVVLHQSARGGGVGGVGFPDNPTDYAVFGVVRFLVFGGLYKMAQAGLRREWERRYEHEPPPPPPPAGVSRLHGAVPARLRRRVGPAVRREDNRYPLDTLEGRKAYWAEIRERGWRF